MHNATQETPLERYRRRMIEQADSDPQLRNLKPKPEVYDAAHQPGLSVIEVIDTIVDGYSDRPALATRSYELVTNEATGKREKQYLPAYSTITYSEMRANARAIASAWRHHPQFKVDANDFVSMIGFTSADYFTIDMACVLSQAVSVPLQSVTSGADLVEIFANTKPVIIAATIGDLATAAEHAIKQGGVRGLVVFDYDAQDDTDRELYAAAETILRESGVDTALISQDELIKFGSEFSWEPLPAHPEGGERMALILHSSGSTGKPKGAVITEKAITEFWSPAEDEYPSVLVVFAPLNHGMGRLAAIGCLSKGGTVHFTLKPDMTSLFEDIRLARPTNLSFFPRVFELIHQHYQNEVSRRVREGEGDEETVSEKVKLEMRHTFLGDRLRGGGFGSAPTAPAVRDFMIDCFDLFLVEAYGNTEAGAGAVTRNNIIQRPNVIDYKLRDVPELGYYTTDKPYPRGELCFKTQFGVKEYFNDPEATANLLDEDGYICSGDIVEEREADHVMIIDRRKDVLKLSQGEYVAVGPLGTVFESGSALIKQIYVYGDSKRSYLLAVVVPDEEEMQSRFKGQPTDAELKSAIRDEMQRVSHEAELKSFEVPRDFIIDMEPFSQENGLLSSVRKRLRPALNRKYSATLDALYEEHEQQQKADLEALKDPNSPLSTLEKLVKLLESHLGREGIDGDSPKTYNELGGDSLGAVLFSMSIEEIFGVALPADSILSPTGSPKKWADDIEAMLSAEGSRATFASVHGKGATQIHGKDLTIDKFLSEDILTQAKDLPFTHDEAKTVLVTGANGFLGRFVALQWMEKVAPLGGKVICIVRGKDDNTARDRLNQVYMGLDPTLETHYQQLASQHLEVLAGDAAEEYLGVGEAQFNRLADEVDRIAHVAALVNHRLGYQHLFAPNVAGTAEIVRLALTKRMKPLDFVSTEAVCAFTEAVDGVKTEESPRIPTFTLTDEIYANGYAASKWAAEFVLEDTNKRFGLPINMVRGGMMLAHQQYVGQINQTDTFTRMLSSIVVTGLAPSSFYPLNDDGTRYRGHYDGIPVNVVAAAVIAPSARRHRECLIYNLNNYHNDDGCSLDSFVDAIESAGYSITRLDDYSEWVSRFREKLKGLPEKQKQRSALDVLMGFETPRGDGHNIGCDRFRDLAKDMTTGTGIPHLDEDFIHKCVGDMQALGFIEKP